MTLCMHNFICCIYILLSYNFIPRVLRWAWKRGWVWIQKTCCSSKLIDYYCWTFSGLLLISQPHNASQLSAWCLHFISSNYVIFKEKGEFSQLVGDDMDYVNQHWWPLLSYEQAMEEYRKKYLEEESDAESGEENSWSEREGGSEGDAGSGEGGEGKSGGGGKNKIRAGRKGL